MEKWIRLVQQWNPVCVKTWTRHSPDLVTAKLNLMTRLHVNEVTVTLPAADRVIKKWIRHQSTQVLWVLYTPLQILLYHVRLTVSSLNLTSCKLTNNLMINTNSKELSYFNYLLCFYLFFIFQTWEYFWYSNFYFRKSQISCCCILSNGFIDSCQLNVLTGRSSSACCYKLEDKKLHLSMPSSSFFFSAVCFL